MKMNRHHSTTALACILMLLCAFTAEAQIRIIPREKIDSIANPKLDPIAALFDFEEQVIDAGRICEDDGPQTYRFEFRNISHSTLFITRLVTNCSCVVAMPEEKWIGPGKTSAIKVIYHPEGHPGVFHRTIRVYAQEMRPGLKSAPNAQPQEKMQLAAFLKVKISVSAGSEKNDKKRK